MLVVAVKFDLQNLTQKLGQLCIYMNVFAFQIWFVNIDWKLFSILCIVDIIIRQTDGGDICRFTGVTSICV